MKSEPESYSIDDLKRDRKTWWTGVRNYQARNFMRDDMKAGHAVLFYHSSGDPSGVAGLARISRGAQADESALDPDDDHYDPKALKENPWLAVEVQFVAKFPKVVSLAELKATDGLSEMLVLKRGQRLSIMPVDQGHFRIVEALGGA
jgi:predicted RNA-binding protein with PUA-like domain